MNANSAWRGVRRIRVALEVGPRSVRVAGMWPLDGPAVQRPALDGTHVAQVMVGGETTLLQTFDDPLLVRGIAGRDTPEHSYAHVEQALVHVDIPIPAESLRGDIAIRIVDLSKLAHRPIEPAQLRQVLDAAPNAMRIVANVTMAELAAHPDWASTGLPGSSSVGSIGSFELYLDRAGMYRWRLRRPGGQIVADSGQGFRNRVDCEAELRWIKEHGLYAPVRPMDLE